MKSKYATSSATFAAPCCTAILAFWFIAQPWHQQKPQDFEQCSEQAETRSSSKDERKSSIAQCDKQFAGRRKQGGGYTYYDFLQDRHFDIAGPIPTPRELRYFDEQYLSYLDSHGGASRGILLENKNGQSAQALFEDRTASLTSPPGPPLLIIPSTVPMPAARSSVVRMKSACHDTSLSCDWTQIASKVMGLFRSTP